MSANEEDSEAAETLAKMCCVLVYTQMIVTHWPDDDGAALPFTSYSPSAYFVLARLFTAGAIQVAYMMLLLITKYRSYASEW